MRRILHNRWGRFALWLLAGGAVLLAFAAFWWFDNQRGRGITFAAPAQPIAWAAVPQGGVNLPSLQYEQPAVISRTLDAARDAGFHFVRVQFPWEDIEIYAKGDFRDYRHDYDGDGATNEADAISAWTKYDGIVAAADARGLELIVRLERPPSWARRNLPRQPHQIAERAGDPGETGPPDDYADYGDYVEAVVGRYRGKVRFFQIWNEPNYGHEWNWADPDPARFVELLKVGFTRTKAANPAAVVLFPSLTPADGLDWKAMSDLEFLERVYQHGGGAYFDIFTAQLYGLGQPPDENRYVRPVYNAAGQLRRDTLLLRPLDSRADVTRVVLLREIMERHGDAAKAVWISEFGWNSNPGPHSFGIPVSEEQKAAYLVGLMERARREWPWMGAMNVWFLRSGAGFAPDDPTRDFQLLREDWSPLPAYAAVAAYLHRPPIVGPGSYALDHPAFRPTADGRLELRFWGEAVQVAGNAEGIAVDGGAQTSGLPLGEHTLIIAADRTGPILVSRTETARWWWLSAPFALLALLIAIVDRGLNTLRKPADA